MYVKKRNIVTCILLSIFTCGIYTIFWLYSLAEDVNALENSKSGTTGGMVILLTIITCGIYGIYFVYTTSKRLFFMFEDHGERASDNSIINLLLSIFGFTIVAYAIMQSDINKLADIRYEQSQG